MATLQELIVKIGADTDGLDKIDQAASKLDTNLEGVRNTGEKLSGTGKSLTAGLTTPIVGMGAAILKTAGDFESSMNGVRAVTGASGQEFDDLQAKAREMGATTAFSATEAAEAMEFLGMAGWDTNEIMSGLPDVLNLAAAGSVDLSSAADIASNIMSGFNIEADEMGRVSDVLANAAANANVDLDMLGESMKYAAPVAQAAGWSLEETAAAVGILGDAGIQGSMAGSGLNNIIATLADTSSTGGRALEEFGVSALDSTGEVRPLTDILSDLADEGADVADVLRIFGLEAGPKMQALLGTGSEGLREFVEDLENSEGAAEDMAAIRMEGLNGSLKELSSAAQDLVLQIGDSGLLDVATKMVNKITEWAQGLQDANPKLLKWGTVIALVLAVLGPLLIILGMTITAIGNIAGVLKTVSSVFKIAAAAKWLFNAALWASPITWIVIGIIALIAVIVLLIVYWDEVKEAVGVAWDWIKEKLASVWDWIKGKAAEVWEGIKEFFSGIWEGIKSGVASAWDWIVSKISGAWDSIVSMVTGAVNRVKDWITNGFNSARDMAVNAFLSLHQRVTSTVQTLLGFVRSIPSRIRSALGNLGSLLTSAGRNVVQGLINGIKSMISNVGSAMSNIASTIRGYLPFSPAEEGPMSGSGAPEVSGARIAETLGEGIMSELHRIDQAADALMAPLDARVAGMRDVARHIPANVNAAVRHTGGRDDRLVLDVTGAGEEWKKLVRRMVRTEAGGDVQQMFGTGTGRR